MKKKRNFKLKIEEAKINPKDKELIARNHRHVIELRSIAKKNKDKAIMNIIQEEISNIRKNLFADYAHKFFKVILSLGPHKKESYYPYYPTLEDIVSLKETMLSDLSKNREDRKTVRPVTREFNGMRYKMLGSNDSAVKAILRFQDDEKEKKPTTILKSLKGGGRVFDKPGTVLNMVNSEEYSTRITRAKKPYDKANYVGVELELICKFDRDKLNSLFIKNKLSGLVYVKSDGSLRADNSGEQTHEVTVISKQPNINNTIERVCKVLNDEKVGAYVNNSCGLHVHLDMRNRDHKVCYNSLFKALPILAGMVPLNRKENQYCMLNLSGDFDDHRRDRTNRRRQAINPVAFEDHQTIEVRLHSGSLNATKINNWINILTTVIDKTEVVEGHTVASPDDMKIVFGISDELVSYIKRRTDKFKKDISTKDDHYDNVV